MNIKLYTTQEVAQLFGVSYRTISRWIRKGVVDPRMQVRGRRKLVWTNEEIKAILDHFFPRQSTNPRRQPKALRQILSEPRTRDRTSGKPPA